MRVHPERDRRVLVTELTTDVDLLDEVFFDFSDGRAAQKARFGGELFPADFEEADTGRSFAEFFQFSREDEPVGIVLIINLQTVP